MNRDGFVAFTERFEGYTDWMYLDVRGLVTIGWGLLIDPEPMAHGLVYTCDGQPATSLDITAAWQVVKRRQDLKLFGGGTRSKAKWWSLTPVRATHESLVAELWKRVERFEKVLKNYFPEWDSWPDDAQLATMSMAWAMGPDFPATWPKFTAACVAQDWAAAAANCRMRDADNPGLRPRNNANEQLFLKLT